MKIKICGITNYEDANLCNQLNADAIGFIFYKESKRYVDPGTVKSIIKRLPPFLVKVGVFVNEYPEVINDIVKGTGLNIVQLHGDEPPEFLSEIHSPVIKAFRVNDKFDFQKLENYSDCAFLLDSFHTKDYGGTGLKFDWQKIPKSLKNKIILAGGISEQNIEFIYENIYPYAVDLSSSVENQPGIKDHRKLKSIFKKLNQLRCR